MAPFEPGRPGDGVRFVYLILGLPSCGYGGSTPERRSRPVTIALP